jgi:hypothetical protein
MKKTNLNNKGEYKEHDDEIESAESSPLCGVS